MRIAPARPLQALPPDADIAGALLAIRPDSLPPDVVRVAKSLVLDTIAVAFAGREASGMEAVWQTVAEEGGAPQSRLWMRGDSTSAGAAAFHNASLASALDFDSLHEAGGVHADAVVIPAALAVGERVGASGAQVLAAYIAGAEFAIRLGLATRSTAGWFRTSVYGVFGAAVAAGHLLGLDREGLTDALGLALAQAQGTQQGHVERRLSKRILAGFAARAGVTAAALAARGVTGPHHVLDGQFGLFSLFDEGEPAGLLPGLGRDFALAATSVKKYPACACAHAAIEAALNIASGDGFALAEVASVEVEITPYMLRVAGAPYARAGDPEVTGQFCLQYAVAAALAHGRFTPSEIAPAVVLDPRLTPAIDLVHLRVRDDWTGRLGPAAVTVTGVDGRRRSVRIDHLPGGVAAPLSLAARRGKAMGAFAAAGANAVAITDAVDRLDEIPDLGLLPL